MDEDTDTWKLLDEDGQLRCEFPKDLGNQVLEYILAAYEDADLSSFIQVSFGNVN